MPYVTVQEYPALAVLPSPVNSSMEEVVEAALEAAEADINVWLGVDTLEAESGALDFYGTGEDHLETRRFIRSFSKVERIFGDVATEMTTSCELFPLPYKHKYTELDEDDVLQTIKVYDTLRLRPDLISSSSPAFSTSEKFRITGSFGFSTIPSPVKRAVAYYANYLIRQSNYSDETRMSAGAGEYQQAQDADQLERLSQARMIWRKLLAPYRLRDIGAIG